MSDTLKEISENAKALEALIAQQRKKEAELDEIKQQVEIISGTVLPQLMSDIQMKEFTLESGTKVAYITIYKGKIPEASKVEAFKYLEDTKNDGIIKNILEVRFDRDQNEAAKQLAQAAMDQGIGQVKIDQTVHPKTLESFIKDQIEAGVDMETLSRLFGAMMINRVTIK